MTHPELAKKALETYIKEKRAIDPPQDLSEDCFTRKAGVFVTIEKNGELRGCIGTFKATKKNIAEEIIANAISAGTDDYRFQHVEESELIDISCIVYILEEPKLVKDLKELDAVKYGIIIISPGKFGLLLPDLDGIKTVDDQLAAACKKADIDPGKENFALYKFSAEKYK